MIIINLVRDDGFGGCLVITPFWKRWEIVHDDMGHTMGLFILHPSVSIIIKWSLKIVKQIHISWKYEANKVWKAIIIIISYIPKKFTHHITICKSWKNNNNLFKRIFFPKTKLLVLSMWKLTLVYHIGDLL
jgi:hypothetical protein